MFSRLGLGILLLQLLAIVAAGRVVGAIFRKIGQTAVIGEMFAGILLGPFLLGRVFPSIESQLFPPASLTTLQLISQLGVVLFMFAVGLSVDVARLQGLKWPESLALGVLMNTRGLMELIVLNIGYDLGILSPTMYTMMVIMALATTCMAGPALALLGRTRSFA